MTDYDERFEITPNLYVTRDEAAIIDYLVDQAEMPRDFGQDQVRSFFVDKDFHLALYFHQPDDRGFQMFVVRDFSVHVDELFMLRDLFAQLISRGHNAPTMKKAHYRVDNMIHMARTFRALMHSPDSLPNDRFPPGTFLNS